MCLSSGIPLPDMARFSPNVTLDLFHPKAIVFRPVLVEGARNPYASRRFTKTYNCLLNRAKKITSEIQVFRVK